MRCPTVIMAAIVTGGVALVLRPSSSRPTISRGESGRNRSCDRRRARSAPGRNAHPENLAERRARGRGADLHVNNTANHIARGDTAVVQSPAANSARAWSRAGARRARPARRAGHLLHCRDWRHRRPADDFGDRQAPTPRNRHAGMERRESMAINNAAEEARLLANAAVISAKTAGRKPVGARGPSNRRSLHTMGLLHNAGML